MLLMVGWDAFHALESLIAWERAGEVPSAASVEQHHRAALGRLLEGHWPPDALGRACPPGAPPPWHPHLSIPQRISALIPTPYRLAPLQPARPLRPRRRAVRKVSACVPRETALIVTIQRATNLPARLTLAGGRAQRRGSPTRGAGELAGPGGVVIGSRGCGRQWSALGLTACAESVCSAGSLGSHACTASINACIV
jgi:hypothetical protein